MSKKNSVSVTLIMFAGLFLVSCASMNQSMRIAPLPGSYPVSASSSLYVDGKTVPASSLQVVRDFEFMKYFSPKLTQKEVELDLASDLTRIVQTDGADAIIRLKISVNNIDTGVLGWIAFERYAGALAILAGLAVMSTGMGTPGGPQANTVAGGVVVAAGVGMIAGSWLHESLATVGYSIHIQGTTVSYK